jgi:hypothetical protein
MKTSTRSFETEAAVWLRILHPDGKLTPPAARAILELALPEEEIARLHQLSARARAGQLTADEDAWMDAYERAGALLSILKSKARQVLKKTPRAS